MLAGDVEQEWSACIRPSVLNPVPGITKQCMVHQKHAVIIRAAFPTALTAPETEGTFSTQTTAECRKEKKEGAQLCGHHLTSILREERANRRVHAK